MSTRQEKIENHITADPCANALGAQLEALRAGYARYTLEITEAMLNFHGITHGGVVFTMSDIAFAAASNSHGQMAVAQNVNITFLQASKVGTRLIAEASEVALNGPFGLYDIRVTDAVSGELIARSQATVYRKKTWFVEEMSE
jgi:acyl-CoA thioesterase